MSAAPRRGQLVAWWEGSRISIAQYLATEGARVRLFSARGREQRVPEGRLAWIVDPEDAGEPGPPVVARLRAASEAIDERAAGFDVALVWELALETGRPLETGELAQLAFGASDGPDLAATARALLADEIHFARKDALWQPRPADTVAELTAARERAERRRREREACHETLRELARGGPGARGDDETSIAVWSSLRRLAVHEDAAPEPDARAALEALQASGLRYDRPHEGAFRLLRAAGVYDHDDVNLWIERYRLATGFADDARAAAERAAGRGYDAAARRDLRDLAAISIDDAATVEIDDLVHAEARDGGWTVGVHIADPTALIAPDDALDRAARERALTHYFPDRRIPMLPPALSEDAASLVEGADRPALSFLVDVDADGEIVRGEIVASVVRSRARESYEGVDRRLDENDEALQPLDAFARAREAARARRGALTLRGDDVEVRVDAAGRPTLKRLAADSPSRRIVTEAMVLAGEFAARFCVERRLPAIFRTQAAPDEPFDASPADAVATRALRRKLKRAESSRTPGRHAGLGLDGYLQVTSPLRRYQDLVLERQILAALRGEAPPYDDDELTRVRAATDPAEADARRAEREAGTYWLLRWYEGCVGESVEGIVVETRPRPIVQLPHTGREQPLPSLRGVAAGDRVELRVERVNPRAGLLVLRRC